MKHITIIHNLDRQRREREESKEKTHLSTAAGTSGPDLAASFDAMNYEAEQRVWSIKTVVGPLFACPAALKPREEGEMWWCSSKSHAIRI